MAPRPVVCPFLSQTVLRPDLQQGFQSSWFSRHVASWVLLSAHRNPGCILGSDGRVLVPSAPLCWPTVPGVSDSRVLLASWMLSRSPLVFTWYRFSMVAHWLQQFGKTFWFRTRLDTGARWASRSSILSLSLPKCKGEVECDWSGEVGVPRLDR